MKTLKLWLVLFASLAFAVATPAVLAQTTPFQTGPYSSELAYWQERRDATIRISREDSLGLIRAVQLEVDDQVDGGCWKNAGAVKARLRVELERSGVAVFDEPLAFVGPTSPIMRFFALGGKVDNLGCAASIEVELLFPGSEELGSLGNTEKVFSVASFNSMWSNSIIMWGASPLDDRVLSIAQEWVDTLAADIAKSKRSETVRKFLETWNSDLPLTAAQWESQWSSYKPD